MLETLEIDPESEDAYSIAKGLDEHAAEKLRERAVIINRWQRLVAKNKTKNTTAVATVPNASAAIVPTAPTAAVPFAPPIPFGADLLKSRNERIRANRTKPATPVEPALPTKRINHTGKGHNVTIADLTRPLKKTKPRSKPVNNNSEMSPELAQKLADIRKFVKDSDSEDDNKDRSKDSFGTEDGNENI